MKKKYAIALIMLVVAALAIGHMTAENHAPVSAKTAENLSSAMHGEAFAYAKYMLYAEHARAGGNEELAKLFTQTAETEHMEHFAEEAQLAGLVGTDEDNLRESIKGETWEYEHMYPDFASQAKAAGDTAAAARFQEIREDEGRHRDAYQAALDKLQAGHAEGGN